MDSLLSTPAQIVDRETGARLEMPAGQIALDAPSVVVLSILRSDIAFIERSGADLLIHLNSGETITIAGFYAGGPDGSSELVLQEPDGSLWYWDHSAGANSLAFLQIADIEPLLSDDDNSDGGLLPVLLGLGALGLAGAVALGGEDDDDDSSTPPGEEDTDPPAAPTAQLADDTGEEGDGRTSDATVNVGGLEPGATWEYSTDGGQTWQPGSGTSFELPPGDYDADDVQVRQTDAAGNTSDPGLLGPVTVDTGIPAAPTEALENDTGAPGDGITSDGTILVSGLEPDATWEYSTDGGATWTPGTGTSFELPPGDYDADDVQVRQTDAAGNTSAPGLLGPVTIDTSNPAAPTATLENDTGTLDDDGITSDGTVLVGGIEPDATWEYSTNGGTTWTPGTGASFELPPGVYDADDVQVRQTDTAGNTSDEGLLGPVTIDITAPLTAGASATLSAIAGDDVLNTVEAADDVPVTVTVAGVPADAVSTAVTITVGSTDYPATANGDGTWTADVPGSALATNSSVSASVVFTDAAGNPSAPVTDSRSYTVDTGAPAAPTAELENDTGALDSDGVTSDGTVLVDGVEPGATWEYSTNGGTTWAPGTGTSFELLPGVYDADDVQVRQTDAAGNISDEGLLGPVTVDTTGPLTAGASVALSAIAGDDVVNAAEAADDVPVTVTVAGVPADAAQTAVTITVGSTDYPATDNGDGTWTADVPGSVLAADSSVSASVLFTDAAGNPSTPVTDSRSYTVDTGIPAAPTAELENDTGALDDDGITSDGTVLVDGVEPGATWEYSTNGGTTWAPGTGTSFELLPGVYDADDVQVRQTDAAGNISDEGLLGPVTVDTTGPATAGASATLSAIAGDDVLNVAEAADDVPVTVTVAGVPADAASTAVTITVGSTDYPASDNGDGTWTADVPGSVLSANSSASASVVFTDTAGNPSAPVTDSRSYTVDTGTPAAPTAELENDTGALDNDGITSDGTVLVDGIEPGATWEYSTDGGTTWDPGTGTSFELSPGVYDADDVQVRQTDAAGNTSDEGLLGPVTIDTSGPATAGASVSVSAITGDDVINALEAAGDIPVTVTVAGVPADAVSTVVTVTVSGADYPATSNGDGTWTATVPGSVIAGASSATGTAVFTDAAGNPSTPVTDTRPYTVDASLPPAPIPELENDTGALDDDGITSDGTILVSGLEPGATWEYSTNGGGSWTPGTGTSFELGTGVYDADDVQVRQTDTEGNTSGAGLLGPVTIDTTGPVTAGASVTLSAIAGDDVVNAAEAAADVPVTVTVAGVPADATSTVTLTVGTTDYPATANGDGTWTADVPGSAIAANSSVTASAVFTDAAGNPSTPVTDTRPYSVDTSLPAAPTAELENDTGTLDNDGITSDGTVLVTGIEPGATWEYSTDGGATWDPGTGTSFELLPGVYDADDVQVRQTDAAGNTSDEGLLGPVTIDTAGPLTAGASVALSAIAGDDVVNATEAAADVPVTVTVAGVPADATSTTVTITVGTTDYPATANGDGTWTADVPGSAIAANSSVTASAVFTDAAGNPSTPVTDTRPYGVDTSLPAAPTAELENDTGALDSDGITSDGTVLVTGIEPGATWEYSTNGGASWTPGTGSSFELQPGIYDADDVQVRQTDAAGNTSDEGLLGPVTVDLSLDAVADAATLDMGEVSSFDYAPQTTGDVQVIGLLETNQGADASAPITVLADRSGDLRIEISQTSLVAVADAYRIDVIDADGNIVYQGATASSPLVGQVADLQVLGLTGANTIVATVTGLPPGTYSVVVHNDSSTLTGLLDTDNGGVSLEELGDAGVTVGNDNQSVILTALSNALGPLGPAAALLLDPVLDLLNGQSVTNIAGSLTGILTTVGFLGPVDDVLDAIAAALLSNTLTLLQETTITTTLTEYDFASETLSGGNVIAGDAGVGADDTGAGAIVTQVSNADGDIELVPEGGSVTIAGEHGELTINSDGSYSYNAYGAPGSVGETDVFTYTLSDGGQSDSATLTITLEGDLVVAADDAATAAILDPTFETSLPLASIGQVVADGILNILAPNGQADLTFTVGADATADVTLHLQTTTGLSVIPNYTITITGPGGYTASPPVPRSLVGGLLVIGDIVLQDLPSGQYNVHIQTSALASVGDYTTTVSTSQVVSHLDQFVADSVDGNLFDNDAIADTTTLSMIDGVTVIPVGGTPVQVVGDYGTLTINADGSYHYQPNAALSYDPDDPVNLVDSFVYRVDGVGGDTATAQLDITIEVPGAPAGFAGFSALSFGFDGDTIPLGDLPPPPDDFSAARMPDLAGIIDADTLEQPASLDALLQPFLDADAAPDSGTDVPTGTPPTPLPEPQPEDPLAYLAPVPIDDQHLQHPSVV